MTGKKKQILQLCHGYAPPFLDVARQYAVLFDKAEYQITTVYLTGKKDQQAAKESASDEVIFLQNTSKQIRGLKLKQIRQVKEIAQRHGFDFVIAHRYKAIYIACHLKNTPIIGVHHAFDDYQRWTRRFFVYRQRRQLFLLGVSNAVRDNLRKNLQYFPPQRIQTLYNRIDLPALEAKQLSRDTAREALNINRQNSSQKLFYFVNVGRLHPDKDQATLLKAFAKVAVQADDVRLMIYGKGRLEKDLIALVNKLQLKDRVFIGSKPFIAHYLRAFDCFILSSDHEPFGMVLLEAMAAELAIISTQEGGAGEVVADSGLLFKQGDIEALAGHMLSMYNMPQAERDNFKLKMNRQLQEKFTDQVAAQAFKQLPFFNT